MEIIFADKYYDTAEWVAGKYKQELATALAEIDAGVSAADTDMGHGADFPAVIVEIFKSVDIASIATAGGLGMLALGGDKLNKSIEGWLEIGKKLMKVFRKIVPARIDESAAELIALKDVFSPAREVAATKIVGITIQVIEFSPVNQGKGKLGRRPDALYIVAVKLQDRVFLYGIRSNSTIDIKQEYSTDWSRFHEQPIDWAIRMPQSNGK